MLGAEGACGCWSGNVGSRLSRALTPGVGRSTKSGGSLSGSGVGNRKAQVLKVVRFLYHYFPRPAGTVSGDFLGPALGSPYPASGAVARSAWKREVEREAAS